MIDVNNGDLYFNILEVFLINHEVSEISQSFIKHYENIEDSYILHLGNYINTEVFDYLSDLRQTVFPHKMVTKRIEVLILFLERFDINRKSPSEELFNTKEGLLEALMDNFYNNDHLDETREAIYSVNGVTITENNVVDFCFAKIKNDFQNENQHNFIVILADYFEYMRLDQQMEFWNILIDDTIEIDNTIESIFDQTTSDAFLNFAFDNYEPLKTENGVYDVILTGHKSEYNVLNFYHLVLQRYPSIRSNLIIYLIIIGNHIYETLFPDLTNQEIISIFRAKFL